MPCASRCVVPSLPLVLAGALMRHHRTRAGLSLQKASSAVQEPASRIGAAETAGQALPGVSVRALLDSYGAPASAIQYALSLVTHPGHLHHIDQIAPRQAWVDALVAGCRSVLVYSADPGALTLLAPTASPAPGAAARGPAAKRRCQMVLLLSESLLDDLVEGHRASTLSDLVRQAENGAVTVHLIPGRLQAPAPLLAEYTNTAWRWDGSSADRLRRQIFATHHYDGTQPSLCNGLAARAERQVMEQAVRTARSAQWSLHRLRQALDTPQLSVATDCRTVLAPRPTTAPRPARRTA
ncbi:hypothetical protein ACPXCO_23755 [Streptomyces cyaneofuscatus]|uniref:hypothetical protein n=1 Tax=Streptomyces cyaneofuscatus TaxID=66883 RepID=UPI003CE88202